ncbi:MAG: DUF5916 domain-containing protein, partial [Chitinophagaceae bacterium]
KNTYNWNGKVAASRLSEPGGKPNTGYSHNLGFSKTGGRLNFELSQEVVNDFFNIADMGYFRTKNFIDHSLYLGYKWIKPGKWFNQLRINYNAGYSRTFNSNHYQGFYTNVNANAQLKNLWRVGGFIGYNPEGNDFYEAQTGGKDLFRTSRKSIAEVWFETNNAKKYTFGTSLNASLHERFSGRSYYLGFFHRYRFNDKLSVNQEISYQPFANNIGFDNRDGNASVFALRNRVTTENEIEAKYSFDNKSGINISIRHYWSEVDKHNFFSLNGDGSLNSYTPSPNYRKNNFAFNQFTLFAEYVRQFAPGSFINLVWKNENVNESSFANHHYFKNLHRTLQSPHGNNLSIRILYYLDYVDIKKWRKAR